MHNDAIYLTDEGRAKLQEELDQLIDVRRPLVAEMIRDAKSAGDISENAAYDEAKEQQAMVEARIRHLEELLARAEAITHNPNARVVSLGSRVTVEEVGTATSEETFHLVGSAEASPSDGRISNESPLGKAILGRKPGDTVSYKTPGGDTLSFRVVDIG
jgi:transcription elongation factor GreA